MTGHGDPDLLGARNPRMQRVRRLSTSRRTRASEGAFVVEGPTLVSDALDAGVVLAEVFHEPGAPADLLERARQRPGCQVVAVRSGVLAAVGDAVTSQGVLGVAAMPEHGLDDIAASAAVLVLSDVADPGNAGTLVRAAEAAGLGAVVFTAGAVDPWSPKVVRASAGSVLRVPVVRLGDPVEVLTELHRRHRPCIGTRAIDADDYTVAHLPAGGAIVLGNEAHGVDPAVAGLIDSWVRIPMAGRVESLNVAMAGTLLAFEVARRG
jgi:TrmH family RNA methyltransferase